MTSSHPAHAEARIRVAAALDLIEMKRLAGRPIDLSDVEALVELSASPSPGA